MLFLLLCLGTPVVVWDNSGNTLDAIGSFITGLIREPKCMLLKSFSGYVSHVIMTKKSLL